MEALASFEENETQVFSRLGWVRLEFSLAWVSPHKTQVLGWASHFQMHASTKSGVVLKEALASLSLTSILLLLLVSSSLELSPTSSHIHLASSSCSSLHLGHRLTHTNKKKNLTLNLLLPSRARFHGTKRASGRENPISWHSEGLRWSCSNGSLASLVGFEKEDMVALRFNERLGFFFFWLADALLPFEMDHGSQQQAPTFLT